MAGHDPDEAALDAELRPGDPSTRLEERLPQVFRTGLLTAIPGATATMFDPAGRPPVTKRSPHASPRRRHSRFHTSHCLGLSLTSSTSGAASRTTAFSGGRVGRP